MMARTLPPVETRSRLHVAQLVTRMDIGGVPDHVMTLVRGLRPDIDVTVVCGSVDPRHARDFAALGVPVRLVPLERLLSPTDFGSLRALVGLIRHERFDVVHTHMSKAALLGGIAARLAGVPVTVNTAHNLGSLAFTRAAARALFRVYDRLLLTLTNDAVVTVSERVRAHMLDRNIAGPQRVVAIPNGIDVSRFHQDPQAGMAVRRAFGVGDAEMLVVTVARLVWFKGLDMLLDAAAAVAERRSDVRFLIVGDGVQRQDLEAQAARLGIADRVTFAGERRDVPELLAAADVFALSSVSEGMPISILEAMASARAVVATDVGGVGELVDHGRTGFLVPPHDAGAFAAALLDLAGDAELRQRMGIAGLARVRDHFSTAQMVRRTRGLYEALMRRKARPTAANGLVHVD